MLPRSSGQVSHLSGGQRAATIMILARKKPRLKIFFPEDRGAFRISVI